MSRFCARAIHRGGSWSRRFTACPRADKPTAMSLASSRKWGAFGLTTTAAGPFLPVTPDLADPDRRIPGRLAGPLVRVRRQGQKPQSFLLYIKNYNILIL